MRHSQRQVWMNRVPTACASCVLNGRNLCAPIAIYTRCRRRNRRCHSSVVIVVIPCLTFHDISHRRQRRRIANAPLGMPWSSSALPCTPDISGTCPPWRRVKFHNWSKSRQGLHCATNFTYDVVYSLIYGRQNKNAECIVLWTKKTRRWWYWFLWNGR